MHRKAIFNRKPFHFWRTKPGEAGPTSLLQGKEREGGCPFDTCTGGKKSLERRSAASEGVGELSLAGGGTTVKKKVVIASQMAKEFAICRELEKRTRNLRGGPRGRSDVAGVCIPKGKKGR